MLRAFDSLPAEPAVSCCSRRAPTPLPSPPFLLLEIKIFWITFGIWQQLGQGSEARQAWATDVLCFLPNNRVIGGKLVQCEVRESSKGII